MLRKIQCALLGSFVSFFIFACSAFAESSDSAGDIDWSGYYVGVQLGYLSGQDDINDTEVGNSSYSDYHDHFDLFGGTGGVFGGCNFQRDKWVFGVEGDLEVTHANGDNLDWPFGDASRVEIRDQASLRGRIGYLLNQRILIYFTGGLALADVKTEYFDGADADRNTQISAGWALGSGVEYAVNNKWTMRLEYRYVEFSDISDVTKTTDPGWEEHNSLSADVIRMGIAYKF